MFATRPLRVELEPLFTIPAYKASDAILGSLEFGATRPINENWIFRSNVSAYRLPDSIVDSPFVTERLAWLLGVNAVYVF